jgi:biotin carboxyl carrier protein
LTRKYELKLNDEIIPVIVESRNKGQLGVTIKGTAFTVQVTEADRDRGLFQVAIGSHKLTLKITPQPDKQGYKVTLNKRDYTAELIAISPESSSMTRTTAATTSRPLIQTTTTLTRTTADPGSIVAPLPGRVIEVRVDDGAKVQAGDVVIVLEAMKMANEIRATQAGVVSKVHVQPGEAVEKGQSLVTIN